MDIKNRIEAFNRDNAYKMSRQNVQKIWYKNVH